MILTISEIASSICSEGKFAGYPSTYVRLKGCNLQCSYCNNDAHLKRKRMGIQTIMSYIFKMGNNHIIITGGEPLLQESMFILVYDLVDRGYSVIIETNGSIEIDETLYKRSYSYSMELKCPSSGMSSKNIYDNLSKLEVGDEVKFIIKNIDDYIFAKSITKTYSTKANYAFVPLMSESNIIMQLSQWLLEDKLPKSKITVPTKGGIINV